jgi:hypothetical protein
MAAVVVVEVEALTAAYEAAAGVVVEVALTAAAARQ